jgi:anion-transporting  ArsA/GET3 family ATPase
MTSPKIDFFCGNGGVGKTTLSASRAAYYANHLNEPTLLMTIDPSKRLKDLFSITSSGVIYKPAHYPNLDVYLMDNEVTAKELGIADNRLLTLLCSTNGPLGEILSLIQLSLLLKNKTYTQVVIDTAPGAHFLEFLAGVERIFFFFQPSFVSLFQQSQSSHWLTKTVQMGLNKALDLVNLLTGKFFMDEFLQAIRIIYSLQTTFTSAASFIKYSSEQDTTFYLVSHALYPDHEQFHELQKKLKQHQHNIKHLYNQSIIVPKNIPKDWFDYFEECNKIPENVMAFPYAHQWEELIEQWLNLEGKK